MRDASEELAEWLDRMAADHAESAGVWWEPGDGAYPEVAESHADEAGRAGAAAALLRSQSARLKEMEAALEPFARAGDPSWVDPHGKRRRPADDDSMRAVWEGDARAAFYEAELTVADFRRARLTLKAERLT